MKLNQLVEDLEVFKTTLLKLVKAGLPVFVDAKSKTFLSGNERMGYEAKRSNHKGWVVQHDNASITMSQSAVDFVKRKLDDDVLHTSTYKESAMAGKGPHSSSLFQFETPIEQNYTIKKIDGTWTIVDREPVDESKKDDHEHAEFMLRQAAKKMVAAGLNSKVMPHAGGVRGPYIETEYAGFKINTFYQPDEDGNKWFGAWFRNGKRTGAISNFKTVEDVIKDIL